jgi:DtxR family manganese transport transcriptional regulator
MRLRHRLMVELLLAVGVPAEAAEADAEGMEHHASAATLAAFAGVTRPAKVSGLV